MITVTNEVVDTAFECLPELYPKWFGDPNAILKLYKSANRAFAGEGYINDFKAVYEELRKSWQVFRGSNEYWSVDQTYAALRSLPQDIRFYSLSEMDESKWGIVWAAIERMQDIKQLKEDHSLVAISKFLHFWNPRLFMVFDGLVLENWVFRHKYLADELHSTSVTKVFANLNLNSDSRLAKYLKVLIFSSDLVVSNRYILDAFASKAHDDIASYEARAAECFLLGLVDLIPKGINISKKTR